MSLLQKASIITTPTAYAEDYLYSIKPAYALGSELVTNGTFNTDSDWTLTSSANIANGKLNVSAGAFDFFAIQVALTNGVFYKISVEVVVTSGSVLLYTGAQFATITTSGVYNYDVTADSTQIRFRSSGSGFVGTIDNVSAKQITNADFDFSRNSTGSRVNEDYLIEDVPYNLSSYSEDFSTAWSFDDCSATNNSAISPDGTLTAALFKGNTNNSAHSMNKSPSPSQPITGTISLFVKSKELKYIQIVSTEGALSIAPPKDLQPQSVLLIAYSATSV